MGSIEVYIEPDDGSDDEGWISMVNEDGTSSQTWAVEMYAQIARVLGERHSGN